MREQWFLCSWVLYADRFSAGGVAVGKKFAVMFVCVLFVYGLFCVPTPLRSAFGPVGPPQARATPFVATAAMLNPVTAVAGICLGVAAYVGYQYVMDSGAVDTLWYKMKNVLVNGTPYSRSDFVDDIFDHNDITGPQTVADGETLTVDMYSGNEFYFEGLDGVYTIGEWAFQRQTYLWEYGQFHGITNLGDFWYPGNGKKYIYMGHELRPEYDCIHSVWRWLVKSYDGVPEELNELDYPELFSDDVIAQNAVDAVGAENITMQFENDGTVPGENDLTEVHPISAMTDDGRLLSDSGQYVDVDTEVYDDVNATGTPVLDSTSVADIQVKTDQGYAPLPADLQAVLEGAGIQAGSDVVALDGTRATWVDSGGQSHVSVVNPSIAELLRQAGVVTATSAAISDVSEIDVEGDLPAFDSAVPVFDTTLNLPEKKEIPFDSWKSNVPFLGALSAFDVEYNSASSVFSHELNIGQYSKTISFDFSDYQTIFSGMGAIIFSCASFLAIKYAIFD